MVTHDGGKAMKQPFLLLWAQTVGTCLRSLALQMALFLGSSASEADGPRPTAAMRVPPEPGQRPRVDQEALGTEGPLQLGRQSLTVTEVSFWRCVVPEEKCASKGATL